MKGSPPPEGWGALSGVEYSEERVSALRVSEACEGSNDPLVGADVPELSDESVEAAGV